MRKIVVRTGLALVFVLFLVSSPVLVGGGVCSAQTIPGGLYFGSEPPGFVAKVFAPGIISLSSRYETGVAFSPSLDECVFGVTNAPWSAYNLWYTKMESDGTWIDPIPAPFQGNGDALCPAYAADGNTIYFASSRPSYPPTRMWRVSRQGGGWGEPEVLPEPIDSGSNEWGGSLTSDGTLYFCSSRAGGIGHIDLYRSSPMGEGWSEPENLGASVNTPQLDGDPYVARDGSYLIFESQRPGGFGQSDLYLSRNEGGVWTTPTNLGPTVNTPKIESGAFISPDGKYLFFTRRAAPVTMEPSELWWIDARAVLCDHVHDRDPCRACELPQLVLRRLRILIAASHRHRDEQRTLAFPDLPRAGRSRELFLQIANEALEVEIEEGGRPGLELLHRGALVVGGAQRGREGAARQAVRVG